MLDRGLISINPCLDKLILALQTCKEENGHVLKEQMQHDDAISKQAEEKTTLQEHNGINQINNKSKDPIQILKIRLARG